MESQNSAQEVYQTLEQAILMGQFKPRERLVERDLVSQFEVSRTPIREALARLRAAGLVRSTGRRGVVVSDFTRKEVEDLYYLREALERAAARVVSENVARQDIDEAKRINQQFIEACESGDLRAMIESNNAFHHRLLETSRNRFLLENLEQVRLKAFLCRYSLWADPDAARASAHDHEAMLAALEKGDKDGFERAVVEHMNAAKEAYLVRHIWS